MKYLAAAVLSFCLSYSISSYAQDISVSAKSALVMDADTSEVLFEKNAGETKSIASITKLMTAVVTLDAGLPLDEVITISQDEVNATLLRGRPTSTTLPTGTKLTRAELLHLTLMNSQNRAAAALARTYPGGFNAFVTAMNAKAKQLNMPSTQYVDATGLFNSNLSTAEDLAALVVAASQYPEITELSTSTSFKLTTYHKKKRKVSTFGTTNRLVVKPTWDIVLQKTGYIRAAGHCVVMMTVINTKRVVIVLLDTVNNRKRAVDAVALKYFIEHDKVASPAILAQLDPYRIKR